MFALIESFKNYPNATIEESPLIKFTYSKFYKEIEKVSTQLDTLSIPKKSIVIIYGIKSQLKSMMLLLGCIHSDFIPFIVENGGIEKIKDLKFSAIISENSGSVSLENFFKKNFLSYTLYYKECPDNFIGNENSLMIVSSSGTTAKIPKKILLGKSETMKNISSNVEALKLSQEEKTLIVLPVSYSYGLIAQFFSHIYVGASIVFATKNVGILQIPYLLNKHNITNIYLTPLLARLVVYYNLKSRPKSNNLNFIAIGGDKPYKSIIKKITNLFNCNIYSTYGLAEAGPRVSTNFFNKGEKCNAITIGKPNPSVKVEIKSTARYNKIFNNEKIGLLNIETPSIYLGYIKGNKIQSPKSQKKIRTKDLGIKMDNGEIVILGRSDQYFVSEGKPIWFYDLNEEIYEIDNVIKVRIQKKTKMNIDVFYRGTLEETPVIDSLKQKYGIESKKDYNIRFIKYDGNLYYK